jgi:DNA-nicking Smr family endonuclease
VCVFSFSKIFFIYHCLYFAIFILKEQKNEYNQLAYAPVKRLQDEYDTLKEDVNRTTVRFDSKWLAKKQQMSYLKKQIMAARENAHNDIYERMNSVGSLGISFSDQSTTVDLHGLSVEAAKRFIDDPILQVLPVLKKITVITGRGLHSENGECVLKMAVESYLKELKVEWEDVKGNEGAIHVCATSQNA